MTKNVDPSNTLSFNSFLEATGQAESQAAREAFTTYLTEHAQYLGVDLHRVPSDEVVFHAGEASLQGTVEQSPLVRAEATTAA